MADHTLKGGRVPIDDTTIALVLELHRSLDDEGNRRSTRAVAAECTKRGRPVSHNKVAEIVADAHSETMHSATAQVREKMVEALDVNVGGIKEMVDLLVGIAKTGALPGLTRYDDKGNEVAASPGQTIAAAKEAIAGFARLIDLVGMKNSGSEISSDEGIARVRRIYGLPDREAITNGNAGAGPNALPGALVSGSVAAKATH